MILVSYGPDATDRAGHAWRTRLALLDRTGGLAGTAPEVFAAETGWGAARLGEESATYTRELAAERGPAAPPVLTVS